MVRLNLEHAADCLCADYLLETRCLIEFTTRNDHAISLLQMGQEVMNESLWSEENVRSRWSELSPAYSALGKPAPASDSIPEIRRAIGAVLEKRTEEVFISAANYARQFYTIVTKQKASSNTFYTWHIHRETCAELNSETQSRFIDHPIELGFEHVHNAHGHSENDWWLTLGKITNDYDSAQTTFSTMGAICY